MGVFVEAILCYGIVISEEDDNPLSQWLATERGNPDGVDFAAFFLQQEGVKEFVCEEPDLKSFEERLETDPDYRQRYEDSENEVRTVLEQWKGIELKNCGRYFAGEDSETWVLFASASEKSSDLRSDEGKPLALGNNIVMEESWTEELLRFCNQFGISFSDPQFFLFAEMTG